MKRFLRLLCVLLCLALLPIPALGEDSAPNVRVLLRRLNLTDRADLILDGVYTAATGGAASMAFPKGSRVTVQIRSGQIYLFYQGMSLQVGDHIRFIRNASADQITGNHARIAVPQLTEAAPHGRSHLNARTFAAD